MRPTALLALLVIVLLPLGLAGWLGLALIESEREAVDHRLSTLVTSQLQALDAELQGYFTATAERLQSSAGPVTTGDTITGNAMRRLGAGHAAVRQVFAMGVDGSRLHPPTDSPLSADESEFLRRSERIWQDKTLLYHARAAIPERANGGPAKQTSMTPSPAEDGGNTSGWYVWYWEAEAIIIYWIRDTRDRLLGFELEPIRVLADVVGLLPATADPPSAAAEARARLVDNRGTLVYQWGDFEPGIEARPTVALPLSAPLGGWQLAYFAAPLGTGRAERSIVIGASVLAAALALAGLAFYLYREHGRESRLARQRVSFVNQVSHELKTPLTNIRLYAELLQQQVDDDDDENADTATRRYLSVVVDESQRLSRLIGNVLSFAGLQRQGLQLHRRAAVIDQVLGSVADAFRPALAERGVVLQFDGNAGGEISVDSDALEQIVNNLLGNAEKYAAGGGRIELSSRHDGDYSIIRVRDYGPGIAKSERERVFEPFYRVDRRLEEGTGGTGIGLSISREIARLHGGDVTLADGSNDGTTVEVRLHTGSTDR